MIKSNQIIVVRVCCARLLLPRLPVYDAVHGSEVPVSKGSARVRVAAETDLFDTAPKAERKTVFPRRSLAQCRWPLKLGSMRRR